MPAILYRLTAPSGKQYIGVTTQKLSARVNCHKQQRTAIGAALRKYGKDSFKTEVLVVGAEDYIYELEENAIVAFNTMPPHGYNLVPGGSRFIHTKQTRQKISKARKGMKFSKQHRENLSNSHKGYVIPDVQKTNMAEAQKKRRSGEPEKVRQTMSEKMKEIWAERSPETRRHIGKKRWDTRRKKED